MTTDDTTHDKRLTTRGARTRGRIVAVAADLMYIQGVEATTLDNVLVASGASKSQLYRHFSDKATLVRAVIDHVGDRIITRERETIGDVTTLGGLRNWADGLVKLNGLRHGAYGCALGSLAAEIADRDELAHATLLRLFTQWQTLIHEALVALQEAGELLPNVAVDQLATGLMAALQGGYLLAQTERDVEPMAISLDLALSHIEKLAAR
ncbi:TetR/AcrR family transcriptional regulator [Cumulibacter soli]|uniref:TetR/AcrR family transcriptional regulator n=1 Tax=Cumulibacter soli TaxID=2546344 RepID=UPI001068061F|nr:TetR/AcrR family transcriptional regulator [Cumulibacter soli]